MFPDPQAKDDNMENWFRADLDRGPFTHPPLEGGGVLFLVPILREKEGVLFLVSILRKKAGIFLY